MRTERNGNRVIVYPEGRIDASNAADLQKELEAVRTAHACEHINELLEKVRELAV